MSKPILAILFLAAAAPLTFAAAPPASHPAAKAAPAAALKVAPETRISYDDAEKHVGEKIIVHTTNRTARTGKLVKFSKTMLTVDVDQPNGGAVEFTFDKAQVAGVGLPVAPPDAAPDQKH